MLAGSLCVPGAPFSLTELFQTDPFGSGWSIAPACPDDSRAAVSENGVVVSETVEDAKGVKRPLIDLTGESDEDEAPKRARPHVYWRTCPVFFLSFALAFSTKPLKNLKNKVNHIYIYI